MTNVWTHHSIQGVKAVDDLIARYDFTPLGRLVLLAGAAQKDHKSHVYRRLQEKGNRSFYSALNEEIQANGRLLAECGLLPDIRPQDLEALPSGSFALQFRFRLAPTAPWYSRDETPLYPLENPVRKEKVFRVPEMAASGWKGIFRDAVREREGVETNERIVRLFGKGGDEDDEGQAGRLRFFPTFFFALDFHVINPHARKTKAGRHPIPFEVVPPNTEGRFVLLYEATPGYPGLAREDGKVLGRILRKVFTAKGFGAKGTSGFGHAEFVPQSREILAKTGNGVVERNCRRFGDFARILAGLIPDGGKS